MKILTGKYIQELDLFTIDNDHIESLDLMEQASEVIAQAICNEVEQGSELLFFIGKGNNGGDGLAVARMLSNAGFNCLVYMVYPIAELLPENKINFERLPESVKIVKEITPHITEETVIIDAVLGYKTKGVANGAALSAIQLINQVGCRTISIDIPSGMNPELDNQKEGIVNADVTLTLEFPKLAMMLPEAGDCCGEIKVLSIGLSQEYIQSYDADYYYITEDYVSDLIKPRSKFSYKNNFGHALLICGSEGMIGSAILATSAALRSGCGLVTAHVPEKDSGAMYASNPSAMLSLDKYVSFSSLPSGLNKYSSIGVGSGLGMSSVTGDALWRLLFTYKNPIVFDADAIKLVGTRQDIKSLIPKGSIFTPHLGELKYLIGEWSDEEDKISKAQKFASEFECTLVVKGAHSMVCMPDKRCYFNSSGSKGMAKAGSGDVLTGFITGLIARGYEPHNAAVIGVYVHGMAGQKAAEYYGVESMNSSDLVDFLAEALNEIK